MKKEIHRSETRGIAKHGWLESHHTFSFADYYNPERMGFGLLRVLNDDIIDASTGFGFHSHDNMEIISIPISGVLRHKDSMGNEYTISSGEVQRMSAGSGITHSEMNPSNTDPANFLQIWILPKKHNIEPSYGQKKFSLEERKNRFQVVVSPDEREGSIWINQNAFLSLSDMTANHQLKYQLNDKKNGAYFFVLSGEVKIAEDLLKNRDAIAIQDSEEIEVQAISASQVLVIEVPTS